MTVYIHVLNSHVALQKSKYSRNQTTEAHYVVIGTIYTQTLSQVKIFMEISLCDLLSSPALVTSPSYSRFPLG